MTSKRKIILPVFTSFKSAQQKPCLLFQPFFLIIPKLNSLRLQNIKTKFVLGIWKSFSEANMHMLKHGVSNNLV